MNKVLFYANLPQLQSIFSIENFIYSDFSVFYFKNMINYIRASWFVCKANLSQSIFELYFLCIDRGIDFDFFFELPIIYSIKYVQNFHKIKIFLWECLKMFLYTNHEVLMQIFILCFIAFHSRNKYANKCSHIFIITTIISYALYNIYTLYITYLYVQKFWKIFEIIEQFFWKRKITSIDILNQICSMTK